MVWGLQQPDPSSLRVSSPGWPRAVLSCETPGTAGATGCTSVLGHSPCWPQATPWIPAGHQLFPLPHLHH